MAERMSVPKLPQLRSFCAIVQEGFSVSRASQVLALSQPVVSKQIKALETELGTELFIRTGNRILGLTRAGKFLQEAARRTVLEADNFAEVRDEFLGKGSGRFVIATTHISACHLLRSHIKTFLERYPTVQLVLRQGMPEAIARWVMLGDAHVGISAWPDTRDPDTSELMAIPCFDLGRGVMAPRGHPLLKESDLSLQRLAEFPIVTLDPATIGGRAVIGAFQEAGIRPNVVLTALDSDVVKSYVRLGLGVGILPTRAYESDEDVGLAMRDLPSLFPTTEICLMLRRGVFLRDYIKDFISWLSPEFDRERFGGAEKAGR